MTVLSNGTLWKDFQRVLSVKINTHWHTDLTTYNSILETIHDCVITSTYTSTTEDPTNGLLSNTSRRHGILMSLTKIPFLVLNLTCVTGLPKLGSNLHTRWKTYILFSEKSISPSSHLLYCSLLETICNCIVRKDYPSDHRFQRNRAKSFTYFLTHINIPLN